MKAKTINSVISKKINDWLKSIKDDQLRRDVKQNIIVTGGCITSMLLNEKVNDFDIYFKTKDITKRVAEYYCKIFNESNKGKHNKIGYSALTYVIDGHDIELWKDGKKKLSEITHGTYQDMPYLGKDWEYDENDESSVKYGNVSGMLLNTGKERIKIIVNSDGIAEDSDTVADNSEYDIDTYLDALSDGDTVSEDELQCENPKVKYQPIFLSTNAITLSDKIQLITRFYGDVKEIHSNYDFVHVTNYWDGATGRVVLNKEALECILNKELKYMGSKYPLCSLIRTRKFIKRGWQINAGQYVKMAFQISELDLKDVYTLEDQLVGVDSIYFLNFIKSLKKLQLQNKNFELTQGYLTSVIDKIFG